MRRVAAAVGLAVLTASCSTPATPTALSSDFAQVFAGRYLGQRALLGPTELTRATLHAQGRCRRSGAAQHGPGEDWVCLVRYDDPDGPATQSFELHVKPDGCWTAEGSATAQPPSLANPETGAVSVNPLAEFDGCLDTSWR